jgi:hypothetical protein
MADKAHEGQVLVIAGVGRPGDRRGCVVGYVDALRKPEPNILARGSPAKWRQASSAGRTVRRFTRLDQARE